MVGSQLGVRLVEGRQPYLPSSSLSHPAFIARDLNRRGELVVADAYNHRIHGLATDGTTLFDWGGKWTGALGIGRFKVPAGVAIDRNGRLHVADSENKRGSPRPTAAMDSGDIGPPSQFRPDDSLSRFRLLLASR